jgi:hypothetical protein
LSYLYQNEKKKMKMASCQRDRERHCMRDGEWLKMEVALVVKMTTEETDHFGIS